ncbi:MAG: hypothetical protein LBT34_03150 [Clostridiales Family XIII bacterium]|nr:hypothetical protein [Clostridiales Family XIII bacterium]
MKVLITFLALFAVNMGFLLYQSGMGGYLSAQTYLKELAEECASGVALYFDARAYADGDVVFNQAEGEKYIAYLLAADGKQAPFTVEGDISCEVKFFDDFTGYLREDSVNGVRDGHPSVWIRLSAETEEFFRLPFISVKHIERQAFYEFPI